MTTETVSAEHHECPALPKIHAKQGFSEKTGHEPCHKFLQQTSFFLIEFCFHPSGHTPPLRSGPHSDSDRLLLGPGHVFGIFIVVRQFDRYHLRNPFALLGDPVEHIGGGDGFLVVRDDDKL